MLSRRRLIRCLLKKQKKKKSNEQNLWFTTNSWIVLFVCFVILFLSMLSDRYFYILTVRLYQARQQKLTKKQRSYKGLREKRKKNGAPSMLSCHLFIRQCVAADMSSLIKICNVIHNDFMVVFISWLPTLISR